MSECCTELKRLYIYDPHLIQRHFGRHPQVTARRYSAELLTSIRLRRWKPPVQSHNVGTVRHCRLPWPCTPLDIDRDDFASGTIPCYVRRLYTHTITDDRVIVSPYLKLASDVTTDGGWHHHSPILDQVPNGIKNNLYCVLYNTCNIDRTQERSQNRPSTAAKCPMVADRSTSRWILRRSRRRL